jgi:26S proteasome regulatory subunit T5
MPEPVTLEDLEDEAIQRKDENAGAGGDGDEEMQDASAADQDLDEEILSLSTVDILTRKRLLENDARIMKSEHTRLTHEKATMGEKIKENQDKITNNKQLPYLVGNVVELLDLDPTAESAEEGANIDLDATRVGKSAVIKTSTRQTIFLPLIGLVDPDQLKPGDLIGVNKESYLVLDTLPAEYDSRVKAMEVDEKPTEKYSDVGGLHKQIEELVEAIVWPMKESERFKKIGIKAPKGALMYGPPGTGKTLLARACAAQTDATFLKLAGPQLVQMFIGDGAKLVRDAFALAKEKAPAIIFIDELDAVGTKRFDSEKSGDREVQRTMLELLNQLDGFASDDRIKVLAATNRIDVLDPALLRSGRLDRKIEFPLPNEEARAQILKIHSRKMRYDPAVNWGELARSTDEFGGAMLKAVCVEAGMIALRMGKEKISHEHYVDAIAEVQAKKKDVSFWTFVVFTEVVRVLTTMCRLSTFTLDWPSWVGRGHGGGGGFVDIIALFESVHGGWQGLASDRSQSHDINCNKRTARWHVWYFVIDSCCRHISGRPTMLTVINDHPPDERPQRSR